MEKGRTNCIVCMRTLLIRCGLHSMGNSRCFGGVHGFCRIREKNI